MGIASLAAPAKLNLHLGIYQELDERGYHRADSVMVALDLCDEVSVEELAAGSGIELRCDRELGIPAHKNTTYRAATSLADALGRAADLRITLRKHVPDQSGMGGSSSDAAAVLLALCELWGLSPSDSRVVAAAWATGADVPFFLDPVPTLLRGAGDVVDRKFPHMAQPVCVVLVRPVGPGVSTPVAYRAFDERPSPPADPEPLCAALRSGMVTAEELSGLLANNLDPVACRLLPACKDVRAWLLAQDEVLGGQVTGSGSCVFGVCASDEAAARVAERAQDRFACWATSAHVA